GSAVTELRSLPRQRRWDRIDAGDDASGFRCVSDVLARREKARVRVEPAWEGARRDEHFYRGLGGAGQVAARVYSARRATTGSTRVARRAGRRVAISATAIIRVAAPA